MARMPPRRRTRPRRCSQAARARARATRACAVLASFTVGAAVLDEHGRVHAGCNVENAAYPQGLCAEAVALGALVLAGGTRTCALLVVVGEAPQPVTPCGGCRQKLREFAGDDTPVWSADATGRAGAPHAGRVAAGELRPRSSGQP